MIKQKNILLLIAEFLVMGGILVAFVIPAFSPPSEELKEQESARKTGRQE